MKENFYKIEDLDVWREGRKLRKDISKLVKKFPKHEKFKLVDQMIRASRSVTANLVEGYGRFHYQENIQFCRQARGSLYEVFDHLTVALDEEYIEESIFEEYKKRIFNIIKLMNGYIKYLKTKKDSDKSSY